MRLARLLNRSFHAAVVVGAVQLSACATTSDPADSSSTLARASGASTVAWSELDWVESCFFFAGPGELGRDDSYGIEARVEASGGTLRIVFPGIAAFEGTAATDTFVVSRESMHDYAESEWVARETIRGAIVDGVYHGTYRYEECDLTHGTACPGACTIAASVRIEPAR